jgi:ABC-type amino acid transport substrate-binding protein
MAALYSNENFPFQVVEISRALKHDVLTSLEAGQANQAIDDDVVLAYATKINRALLTINRHDFVREHNKTPNHAGIIVCSQDSDVEGQAQRINQAIKDNEPLAGKLIRVNRPQK